MMMMIKTTKLDSYRGCFRLLFNFFNVVESSIFDDDDDDDEDEENQVFLFPSSSSSTGSLSSQCYPHFHYQRFVVGRTKKKKFWKNNQNDQVESII